METQILYVPASPEAVKRVASGEVLDGQTTAAADDEALHSGGACWQSGARGYKRMC